MASYFCCISTIYCYGQTTTHHYYPGHIYADHRLYSLLCTFLRKVGSVAESLGEKHEEQEQEIVQSTPETKGPFPFINNSQIEILISGLPLRQSQVHLRTNT